MLPGSEAAGEGAPRPPGGTVSAGVLYVHSCPPVLCPHVEWAVAAELGTRARMEWSDQPAAPGQLRAEINWRGRPGTAGRLAAALRGWTLLRYEVTEEPSAGRRRRALRRHADARRVPVVDERQRRPARRRGPAARPARHGHRPAARRRASTRCSAAPGTTSSSPTARPATAPRSPGCTRSSERAGTGQHGRSDAVRPDPTGRPAGPPPPAPAPGWSSACSASLAVGARRRAARPARARRVRPPLRRRSTTTSATRPSRRSTARRALLRLAQAVTLLGDPVGITVVAAVLALVLWRRGRRPAGAVRRRRPGRGARAVAGPQAPRRPGPPGLRRPGGRGARPVVPVRARARLGGVLDDHRRAAHAARAPAAAAARRRGARRRRWSRPAGCCSACTTSATSSGGLLLGLGWAASARRSSSLERAERGRPVDVEREGIGT